MQAAKAVEMVAVSRTIMVFILNEDDQDFEEVEYKILNKTLKTIMLFVKVTGPAMDLLFIYSFILTLQ